MWLEHKSILILYWLRSLIFTRTMFIPCWVTIKGNKFQFFATFTFDFLFLTRPPCSHSDVWVQWTHGNWSPSSTEAPKQVCSIFRSVVCIICVFLVGFFLSCQSFLHLSTFCDVQFQPAVVVTMQKILEINRRYGIKWITSSIHLNSRRCAFLQRGGPPLMNYPLCMCCILQMAKAGRE